MESAILIVFQLITVINIVSSNDFGEKAQEILNKIHNMESVTLVELQGTMDLSRKLLEPERKQQYQKKLRSLTSTYQRKYFDLPGDTRKCLETLGKLDKSYSDEYDEEMDIVTEALEEARSSIAQITQIIESIKQALGNETSLRENIEKCEKNPQDCSITGSYNTNAKNSLYVLEGLNENLSSREREVREYIDGRLILAETEMENLYRHCKPLQA